MDGVLPRLGVVVLNWNGRAHLEACLPSLLDSDHPDFFVLVVDNASVDDSVEWMARNHPGVEVLSLPENLRFAGGNNAGARRAIERGAELLLILNNDTTVDDRCLSRLAEALVDPAVGVAGPRIVFAEDRSKIWYGGGVLDLKRGRVAHRAIRRAVTAGADPAGETGWVSGCALAVRAQVWQQLGGLDESFYIYSEDVDFCVRAADAGQRLVYVPGAVVAHQVSASVGGRVSAFKAYHRTRARLQFFRRHGRGVLWRFGACLEDLSWAIWLLAHGAFTAAGSVFEAWTEPEGSPAKHPVDELRVHVETPTST